MGWCGWRVMSDRERGGGGRWEVVRGRCGGCGVR